MAKLRCMLCCPAYEGALYRAAREKQRGEGREGDRDGEGESCRGATCEAGTRTAANQHARAATAEPHKACSVYAHSTPQYRSRHPKIPNSAGTARFGELWAPFLQPKSTVRHHPYIVPSTHCLTLPLCAMQLPAQQLLWPQHPQMAGAQFVHNNGLRDVHVQRCTCGQ